jgi:adenosine deaminase
MKNARFSDLFLLKIPKTDLHCHLDGSIRLETLIDLAQKQNIHLPAYTVDGLRKLVFKHKYTSLEDYLKCFAISASILTNQHALSRVAYELAVDQYSLGVRYFEVRFAPQLHAIPEKLSVEEGVYIYNSLLVLLSVNNGLQKATIEFNKELDGCPSFNYGIICCAMRGLPIGDEYGSYIKQFGKSFPLLSCLNERLCRKLQKT